MNYKLVIQYDGTRYEGWQRQKRTKNTIQGKIEEVLSHYLERDVEIHGAGRTDAGVHALGQVANFHVEEVLDIPKTLSYLNQYLPYDMGILSMQEVGSRFHSRLNAKEKTYCYHIHTSKAQQVFDRKYGYLVEEKLNLEKMREAASYLIGEQDFRSFSSNKKTKKSTVRSLYEIKIEELNHNIQITYRGNGFLYNMVRILTGTLIEVGLDKKQPKDMMEILKAHDRSKAGITAPPSGLFLYQVKY